MAISLDMTRGKPGKQILFFSLPLMLGNVFQQLYTVVDTAIVGRGVGMEALAALGTVDWLNWMYLGIVQGFAQGFSVLMAQKFGEKDYEGLKSTVGNAARLSIVIGFGTLILSQLAFPVFLKILQVPGSLQQMATLYSRLIMLGIPATMLYNFSAGVLRSVGDSRTPLFAMAVASVMNIVLDCVAVFLLNWGIAGAAIATVIAQLFSGMICFSKIRKTPLLRFDRDNMRRNPGMTKRLLWLGVPVTIQNTIISVGGMAVTSVVNQFETTFIAGFVATNKLYGVLEMASLSYGHAVTTYVGQNYGAGLLDRIRTGVRKAVWISVVTSIFIGAVMILFGREITMLFISSESAVISAAAGKTAYQYLCVMSIMLPVLYLLYVYRSALQGLGNTTIPMISGVVEFVIRVGGSILVGLTLWQKGIFLAEVGAWLGAATMLAGSYYHKIALMKKPVQ